MPCLGRYRWRVAVGLGALVLSAASLLSVPQFLGQLIDRLSRRTPDIPLDALAPGIVLFIAIFAASTALRTYMVTWVGERVIADLRKRIYAHLLRLHHEFFEARATGELLSRVSNDITSLQTVISIVLVIGLQSGIQLAGALVMMARTSVELTMLAMVILPPLAGIGRWFGRRVRARSLDNRDREACVVAEIEESINAIDVIKAFTAEAGRRHRFDRQVEACFEAAEGLMRARAELTLIVVVFVLGAATVVTWVGIREMLASDISGGTLAEFLLYLSVASFSLVGLSEIHGEIRKALGATERLFGLLDETPEIAVEAGAPALPAGRGAVEFVAVDFSYPARPAVPVLRDFSLSIGAGETVALIGPSGAGKTTVLRLLLRFHAPSRGLITVDGADIGSLDVHALRRDVAVVPQEPLIFSGTAMENVRYGRPDASDRDVIEAATLAQADPFLRSLPAGYETPLGPKGHQLSSGQRQRLTIARAILRRPRLVLFDEPSSFLDPENEVLLRDALLPFLRHRTSLIVTHRPSVAQRADRVVVLDRGRIIAQEAGPELAGQSGLYRQLMHL